VSGLGSAWRRHRGDHEVKGVAAARSTIVDVAAARP